MSKQDKDSKDKGEEKDDKREELARVFSEHPINVIEKPARRTRLFFIVLIASILLGFAGGIMGELGLNYLMLTGAVNLPWFNKLRLEQYLPTKELVVTKRESVTVAQDVIVSEAVKKLNESQISFFKKFSANEKGNHIYDSSRLISQGIALTDDGWIAAPLPGFAGKPDDFIGMDAQGEVFALKQIIPDGFSGIVYVKTEEKNLRAPAFIGLDKLVAGSLILASDPFGKFVYFSSIGSTSATPEYPKEFSDRFSRVIAPQASLSPQFVGSGVILLSGEVIGIALKSDQILPIERISNRLKEVIDKGSVDRGYLGVSGIERKAFLENSREERKGVLITGVDPNGSGIDAKGPAAKGGLRDGDIILSVDGEAITGDLGLGEILSDYKSGDEVEVKYLRKGREKTTNIKLEKFPAK